MLEVQKFLLEKSLEELKAELGINYYLHPTLPLVGFKYDQIDSPKAHPVVRECRGLVLEDKTWKIVAKPFNRFFNVGELAEEFAEFDWNDCSITAKEDGSLIIMYYYAGSWHVNTSGSFGLGSQQVFGGTWRELFYKTAGDDILMKLDENKFHDHTLIFELCTVYNKIVRTYKKNQIFLLAASQNNDDEWSEHSDLHVDTISTLIGVQRPERWTFTNQEDICNFLLSQEEKDPTFEGVVLRDKNNLRYKWKTSTYVSLHKLKDNGNVLLPKNLVPLVLAGEADEKKVYLPEISSALDAVAAIVDDLWSSLKDMWIKHSNIVDQKEFALSIKEHPLSSILFMNRKQGGDLDSLKLMFRKSDSVIVKRIFGNRIFEFDGEPNEPNEG